MRILHIVLLGVIACNLAACGTKGRLKSPAQIEAEEAKKARKSAKKAEDAKKEAAEKAQTEEAPQEAE